MSAEHKIRTTVDSYNGNVTRHDVVLFRDGQRWLCNEVRASDGRKTVVFKRELGEDEQWPVKQEPKAPLPVEPPRSTDANELAGMPGPLRRSEVAILQRAIEEWSNGGSDAR